MNQNIIDNIIKDRCILCEQEVVPLIEKPIEELKEVSINRETFQKYMHALGQFTMSQIAEVKEPVLSVYDHYQGRLEGIQMLHRLLSLVKAPKETFICDRADTPYEAYKCGYCGTEIYEDDNFCSNCGVMLYNKEEEDVWSTNPWDNYEKQGVKEK